MVLLISCLFLIPSGSQAQDVRSRLRMGYIKKADDSKHLTAKLLLRQGRRYVPASDFTITYSLLNNETEVELGTAHTDENGDALFVISPEYKIPVNEENFATLIASFAGNDTCRGSSAEVEVKDILVQIETGDAETKTISVILSEKDSVGNNMPVQEEFVSIYIERLYSLLPIGDGVTDENGVLDFTYEDDIPGDAEGNINVIVKLEESELFGTVEANKNAGWGTPVSYEVDVSARALWSDQAPHWMIIATFIVLAGAWFNFILAMVNLFKIKKAGQK